MHLALATSSIVTRWSDESLSRAAPCFRGLGTVRIDADGEKVGPGQDSVQFFGNVAMMGRLACRLRRPGRRRPIAAQQLPRTTGSARVLLLGTAHFGYGSTR